MGWIRAVQFVLTLVYMDRHVDRRQHHRVPPPARSHPTHRRLGHRIRTLRLAKGWTQEDLAAEGGLDRSYASGLESGRRNATCLRLLAVAKALNVSVQSFSMCSC